MKIALTGKTKVLGIIGSPVGHSLSPLMQNAAIEALGLDYIYVPFPVPPDCLKQAVEGLRNLGVVGFNVTIPFKTDIIPYLDKLTPEAEVAGAVNTVNREGDLLVGYNTDGLGLLNSLEEDLGFTPAGSTILILGAGGAARGAVAALAKAGAGSITVSNRTLGSAEGLIASFSKIFSRVSFGTATLDVLSSPEGLKRFDLIVNTTSVGMNNTAFDGFSLSSLESKACFYDMVYAPPETPFLQKAWATGHKAANGLGMLAAQGEVAFAVWTGRKPPAGLMKHCLLTALKAK